MQYYFDTLFPRIPVPVLRTVVSNLESMKLPTKHCGVTGESTRGSEESARRPPSVKASLSVSFGQRAPHRASTRGSSPVRRTSTPSRYDRDDDSRRSPSNRRSRSRDLSDRDYSERDRDSSKDRTREHYSDRERIRVRERDRAYDYDRRSRDRYRRDYYERSGREEHNGREGSSRRSRSRSRSRSRGIHEHRRHDHNHPSPSRNESKEKTSASSNLAKLKDLYGDLGTDKKDAGEEKGPNRATSGTEEVIRLGGSWR